MQAIATSTSAGRWAVAAILAGECFFAGQSLAQEPPAEEPKVTNPMATFAVGVFARPSVNDGKLVEQIADLGAPQQAWFPAGYNVIEFIATKCGRPSPELIVHPAYEERLLARNPSITAADLTALPRNASLEIPACAAFAEARQIVEAPEGIAKLAESEKVAFDVEIFEVLAKDEKAQAALQEGLKKAEATGNPQNFEKAVQQICSENLSVNFPSLYPDRKFPGFKVCRDTAAIVAANPKVTDANAPVAVAIPAIVKSAEQTDDLVRVLLAPASIVAAAEPKTPIKSIESGLRFVTEISSADKYGKACGKAHEKRKGAWPFDLTGFLLALSFSDIPVRENAKAFGKILVVDSGFDFAQSDKTHLRRRFSARYFGEFPGVTLTGGKRILSAATSPRFVHRSHGLTVMAIASGGREFELIRGIAPFPLNISVANIVPPYEENPKFNVGHIERALKEAARGENDFNVINLSLRGPDPMDGLRNKKQGWSRVIVVAAGNDGLELNSENMVWPAGLGGRPKNVDANEDAAFITVGAQDADGNLAGFSNSGEVVDLLAPGCMVPSYDLAVSPNKKATGITPKYATGTSFAAPVVSFVAALLQSSDSFKGRPGLIKERIQAASNYNASLYKKAFSSGTLNVAKVIGFRYDILDIKTDGGGHRLAFGTVQPNAATVTCKLGPFEEPIDFDHIRKIAMHDKTVLILFKKDREDPSTFDRKRCEITSLDGLEYEIEDAQDGTKSKFKATEVWDYIPRQQ